jgi:hypothetical protein
LAHGSLSLLDEAADIAAAHVQELCLAKKVI